MLAALKAQKKENIPLFYDRWGIEIRRVREYEWPEDEWLKDTMMLIGIDTDREDTSQISKYTKQEIAHKINEWRIEIMSETVSISNEMNQTWRKIVDGGWGFNRDEEPPKKGAVRKKDDQRMILRSMQGEDVQITEDELTEIERVYEIESDVRRNMVLLECLCKRASVWTDFGRNEGRTHLAEDSMINRGSEQTRLMKLEASFGTFPELSKVKIAFDCWEAMINRIEEVFHLNAIGSVDAVKKYFEPIRNGNWDRKRHEWQQESEEDFHRNNGEILKLDMLLHRDLLKALMKEKQNNGKAQNAYDKVIVYSEDDLNKKGDGRYTLQCIRNAYEIDRYGDAVDVMRWMLCTRLGSAKELGQYIKRVDKAMAATKTFECGIRHKEMVHITMTQLKRVSGYDTGIWNLRQIWVEKLEGRDKLGNETDRDSDEQIYRKFTNDLEALVKSNERSYNAPGATLGVLDDVYIGGTGSKQQHRPTLVKTCHHCGRQGHIAAACFCNPVNKTFMDSERVWALECNKKYKQQRDAGKLKPPEGGWIAPPRIGETKNTSKGV